jgi:hypothetical protein
MNHNNKEDETAIIVATAVVAILYRTVPEKEKRVASVFDQCLCWNNDHSLINLLINPNETLFN